MVHASARRGISAGLLLSLSLLGVPLTPDLSHAAPDADPDSAPPIVPVGEVSITAQRGERDPLRTSGNVTVLDRKKIERSGTRTIGELLEREPGLFVTRQTSSPVGVQVEARGFNNGGALGSSLLVQIDGRRVNEADTGNTDWSLIPLDRVESIEIVRGAASALYGDNAVGGVIDIRTLPNEGPARAAGNFYYGKHETHGGNVWAAASVGELTLGAFFSGLDTEGFRDRSSFDRKHVEGSLEWRREGISIGGKAGFTDSFRELPGSLDPLEILGPRGRRAADPDSTGDESDVRNWFVQGWIETFLADDIQLRVAPQFNMRSDDVLISTTAFGQFSIETEKNAVGVDAQLRVDRPLFGFESRFIGGFEFLYQEVETLSDSGFGTNAVNNYREVYSGYIQEELALTEQLLVTAGLRLDRALYEIRLRDITFGGASDQNPGFTIWSPRASVNYAFLPCLTGYFSYARGFRLPNFDEEAPFIGAIPDLEEQISDTVELGFKGRSDWISASFALYWTWVDNEILFDPFDFSNTNLDETRHRGIEASVEVRPHEWVAFYAGYTLDDVEITSEVAPFRGERMPITPLHRGSLGMTLTLPCDLSFNAHANLVGSRRLSNDFDGVLPELDPYETLDLVGSWRPEINDHLALDFTGGVYNVTNERYEGFGARFDVGPFPGVPTTFLNPATQRTWRIGVGFRVTM